MIILKQIVFYPDIHYKHRASILVISVIIRLYNKAMYRDTFSLNTSTLNIYVVKHITTQHNLLLNVTNNLHKKERLKLLV